MEMRTQGSAPRPRAFEPATLELIMQQTPARTVVGAAALWLALPAFAAEDSEQIEGQAAPMACAEEVVYGDPEFANLLEYSFEGKQRRLHFEAMEVVQNRGSYDVRVPRVIRGSPSRAGWINAGPASASLSLGAAGGTRQGSPVGLHVVIDPGETFASNQVQLRSLVLPSLDCLQEMPGFPSMSELFSGRDSDFTYTWGKRGEGPWLTLESQLKEGDATLRLQISTPAARRAANAAPAAAAYLAQGAVEADGLVYAALDVIHVEPVSSRSQGTVKRPFTLPLPAAGKRLARLAGDYAEVYEYQVLESDLVVVDQHRIEPAQGARDPGSIFELPPNPLGGSLDDVVLDASTRLDRFVISRVSPGALPPLRLEVDATAQRPQRPAMLALHELPPSLPTLNLARLEPHAFTLTDGGERVRLTMRSTIVGGREFLECVEDPDAPPAAVPAGAEARIVEQIGAGEYQALQALFAGEGDWPPYWQNDAERQAFLSWITPLFIAMDIPTGDLQTIREAEDASALVDGHFGVPLVDLAYLIFQNREFANRSETDTADAAPPGPSVVIDPDTARPLSRREHLVSEKDDLTLDIAVAYGDSGARLQAQNEVQGTDVLDLPLPPGVFDASQVLSLIPFIPLADGERRTLYMLDLVGQQRVRSSSTESLHTAHIVPYVSRLTLELDGRETLPVAEGDIPVLRVRGTLVGLLPPPLRRLLVAWPPLDAEGAQVFELLLRATAPHHLLRIRVGDQEIAGDSHSVAAVTE